MSTAWQHAKPSYQNQTTPAAILLGEKVAPKTMAVKGTYNASGRAYPDVATLAGKLDCKFCSLGKYNDLTGKTDESSCKDDCPAGSYIVSARSSCKICPQGYWQDQDDIIIIFLCVACVAGLYNDETGKSSPNGDSPCKTCLAGQSSDVGSAKCQSCEAGMYSNVVGGTCQLHGNMQNHRIKIKLHQQQFC